MLILFKSDLRYRLEQNRKYILKIPTSDFPQKLSDNQKNWCWKCFRKVTFKKPAPVVYEEKKRSLAFFVLLSLAGCIDLRFCDESSFNLEPMDNGF